MPVNAFLRLGSSLSVVYLAAGFIGNANAQTALLAARADLSDSGYVSNMVFDSPLVNMDMSIAPTFPHANRIAMGMSASVVDFKHGVASGDPLADSVILWTKVTPTTPQPVSVNYQVSLTKDFAAIISQGTVLTSSEVDYTVKVDVSGLSPSTTYYYRFVVGDTTSPVGRTKTLPAENVDPENVKLAVVSCSNLPYGFFNAYGNIAKKDVDMVLHLGDYIYEYGNGEYGDGSKFNPPRIPQPNAEILSLSDYRQRHAQYKTDPDLQAAHQSHPFITIWDDHEFTDNATPDGAANHQANEGPWSVRRLNAIRAYFEYMPIRQAATDHFGKIYRSFKVGKMLDLIMLDTRMHGMDNGTSADPSKNLLGKTQESWLHSTLSASKSRGAYWRVLGNQVIMAPLTIVGVNPSALEGWDDFPDTRARLLSHLTSNSIKNNIVVTGDLHIAMAMNVPAVSPYNPFKYNWRTGEGSVLVEFVGTSVTSPGFNWALQSGLKLTQPHMWHVNGGKRGYMIVDLRREVAKSEYWIVDSVDSRNPSEKLDAVVQTLPGTGRISRVDTY